MHMTRRTFMKKFLIVIASLVLDIIILGGITLGCYFLSTLANFCLNLLQVPKLYQNFRLFQVPMLRA